MSLPWFPLYANDLSLSTATMTASCLGSYIRLLCYAWSAGGIPNDYEICSRIAVGMTPTEWNEIRSRLELVADSDSAVEKLVHPRMERERERTETIRQSRREAAARTNAARWGADRVGDRSGDRVAERSYPHSQSHTQEQDRVADRFGKRKHDAAAQLKRIQEDET
jgi:uncharacterized protein YdaU (DUF1376 family)